MLLSGSYNKSRRHTTLWVVFIIVCALFLFPVKCILSSDDDDKKMHLRMGKNINRTKQMHCSHWSNHPLGSCDTIKPKDFMITQFSFSRKYLHAAWKDEVVWRTSKNESCSSTKQCTFDVKSVKQIFRYIKKNSDQSYLPCWTKKVLNCMSKKYALSHRSCLNFLAPSASRKCLLTNRLMILVIHLL